MSNYRKVCLVKVSAEQGSFARVLDGSAIRIGRSPEVEVAINDAGVSRQHIEVKIEDDQIWLSDLGSSNGTFINDNRLEPEEWVQYQITDQLLVGRNRVQVTMELVELALQKKGGFFSPTEQVEADKIIDGAKAEASRIIDLAKSERDRVLAAVEPEKQKVIEDARKDSQRLLADSHTKAKTLFNDATEKARQVVEASRVEADKLVADAQEEIRNEQNKILAWREETIGSVESEIANIRAQAEADYQKAEQAAADRLEAQMSVAASEMKRAKERSDAIIELEKENWETEKATELSNLAIELTALREKEMAFIAQAKLEAQENLADIRAKRLADTEAERKKILEEAHAQYEIAKTDAREKAKVFSKDAEEMFIKAKEELRRAEEYNAHLVRESDEYAKSTRKDAAEKLSAATQREEAVAIEVSKRLAEVDTVVQKKLKEAERERDTIVDKAKAEAKTEFDRVLFEAKKAARVIESEALSFAYDNRRKIELEAQELINGAREQGKQLLAQAKTTGTEAIKDAENEAAEIVKRAQSEVTEIMESGHRAASREKELLILQTRQEMESLRATVEAETEAKKQNALSHLEKEKRDMARLVQELENQVKKAEIDADEVIAGAKQKAESIVEKAQEKSQKWLKDAEVESQDLVKKTKDWQRSETVKLENYLREQRARIETEKAGILEAARGQAQQSVAEATDKVRSMLLDAEKSALALETQASLEASRQREAHAAEMQEERSFVMGNLEKNRQELKLEIEQLKSAQFELSTQVKTLSSEKTLAEADCLRLRLEFQELHKGSLNLNMEIDDLCKQVSRDRAEAAEVESRLAKVRADFEQGSSDREKQILEISTLSSESKQARLELEGIQRLLAEKKRSIEQEATELRESLRQQMENMKSEQEVVLAQSREAELTRIQDIITEGERQIRDHREKISRGISAAVSGRLSMAVSHLNDEAEIKAVTRTLFEKELTELIQEELFKNLFESVGEDHQKLRQTAKKYSKQLKYAGGALAASLAAMLALPASREWILSSFRGQSEKALSEYTKGMQAERSRRYQPEKDSQWRDSYTDAILYTDGFAALKLEEEYQNIWIRKLQDYLLTKLRIPEDRSIKIFSLEAALVTRLKEQADSIHPESVAASVEKMRGLENETVAEMKKIIGGEQNFDAFTKFSRDFYYNEFLLRRPASRK